MEAFDPRFLDPIYAIIVTAVLWWRTGETEKKLTSIGDEVKKVSETVTDMRLKFWSEKWPMVERLEERVGSIENEVVEVKGRVTRLETKEAS